MAIQYNEVLRPRPDLLVIRQTRLEPTLMTVFGSSIMGLGVFVFVQTTSGIWFEISFPEQLLQALIIRYEAFLRMFEEGFYSNMNTANIVTFVFSSLLILFGMALFGAGIRRLFKPVEHQFDHREKTYLRNGNMIARFDEIQDIFMRSRTSTSEVSFSTWFQLYLVLQSRKPIKLMKTSSGERALELVREITSAIGIQTEQAEKNGSAGQILSWTNPPWLKWLMLLIIGLFLVIFIDGFFLGLIPEASKFWMIGFIVMGIIILSVGSNFGKITKSVAISEVQTISKKSLLSTKIRVVSIIVSLLTVGIYLYYSSFGTQKEKPINTPSFGYDFSPLNEKFGYFSENWYEEENDYFSAGISSGKYVVLLKEDFGSGTFRASHPVRYCKECDLSMKSSKIEGNELWGYGLYFGGQQIGMSFLTNGSGQYSLREFRGDSVFYNKAGDFSFSPHINQGNGNNLLKVHYKGDHVILWANGEMLESISINPSFRITRVGLVVDSGKKSETKQKFEIHFDNLRYFIPEKQPEPIKAVSTD